MKNQIYESGDIVNGKYKVVSHPLMGGMDIFYLYMNHEDDHPVAHKTFKPEYLPNRETRDRFLREGAAWINLGSHPHIVRCFDSKRNN